MVAFGMAQIKLLVPDLPSADSLLPLMRRIDNARYYTNFGPLVRELEAALCQNWPGTQSDSRADLPALQVVTLNSGTAPLELCIAALALPRDSHVLMPAYTFPATASAVLRNGLCPIFGDLSPDHWQLTPAIARETALKQAFRLVMPVATFGCPLDVHAWDAFAQDTGIAVLMDAAGAFGSQDIGRLTHVSFSLHATKPYGIGEGGLLVTRNAELAHRVRHLSNFGFENGLVTAVGTNAKLSEYAAAVGLAQWARWPELQARRGRQWKHYCEHLAVVRGIRLQAGFEKTVIPTNVVISLSKSPEAVMRLLGRAGIETRRWYYPPLHRHPAFAKYSRANETLPVTQRLASGNLGLPWHNFLSDSDLSCISKVLETSLEETHR